MLISQVLVFLRFWEGLERSGRSVATFPPEIMWKALYGAKLWHLSKTVGLQKTSSGWFSSNSRSEWRISFGFLVENCTCCTLGSVRSEATGLRGFNNTLVTTRNISPMHGLGSTANPREQPSDLFRILNLKCWGFPTVWSRFVRFRKLREACTKNFHLVVTSKTSVVTSYDPKPCFLHDY